MEHRVVKSKNKISDGCHKTFLNDLIIQLVMQACVQYKRGNLTYMITSSVNQNIYNKTLQTKVKI